LSAVDIVESHDVVLTEIASDLNLDQFERDLLEKFSAGQTKRDR
jgi:hypothetical protein